MKKLLQIIVLFNGLCTYAQVGINTTAPDISSMLDITSTNKGILIPRMSEAQKLLITTPATGLLVFQTDVVTGFYYYNGTVWIPLSNVSTSEIQKIGNIIRNTTDLTNDSFIIGSTSMDNIAGTNDDKRMFYDKAKGAFRVGFVSGPNWDNAFIGINSFASGNNTQASGDSSTAMGLASTASGDFSTAIGLGSVATGNFSMALGNLTSASGNLSTAIGVSTIASGEYSTAMGRNTTTTALSETALGQFNTDAITPDATTFVATDRLLTVGNGTSVGTKSNALTILKNGNTAIGNIDPTEKLEVDGKTKTLDLQVTTATAPVVGQVLTATDVNGNMSWQTLTAASEIQKFGTIIRNTTDLTNDNFVIGSTSIDDIAGINDNSRMFYNKAKGAFRAGYAVSTQWDDANIGNYSLASGLNTIASGLYATAMGRNSTASAERTTAIGGFTTASGIYATAIGNTSSALAPYSMAMGTNVTASGTYATAIGRFTTAPSYGETVLGLFNSDAVTPNAGVYIATDRLFSIGNGNSPGGKSNALTILKNGNTAVGNINPTEKLEVDGKTKTINLQVTTATAPIIGQVLTATDVVGNMSWQTPTATSEIKKFGTIIRNTSDLTNDNFVIGSTILDDITGVNDDKRMFFNKAKGAFRVGVVSNTKWDDVNVGSFSFASGQETRASGEASTALGLNTTASGYFSTAMGVGSVASGDYSTATGTSTFALGKYSTTMGFQTIASANRSTAMGSHTTAQSYSEIALGQYNTDAITPNSTTFIGTDRLLTVGNGILISSKSNALTILKNGNTAIGNINPTEKLEVDGKTKTIDLQVTTATAPVIGQVLTAIDVLGNMSWQNPAPVPTEVQRFGTTIRNTSDYTTDSFLIGSTSMDDIAGLNDNKRMFFNKAKGAFRVGGQTSSLWDNANVGIHSFASGYNTIASGDSSSALGKTTIASGDFSTATGLTTTASGDRSTAMGYLTTASGQNSTALGAVTVASAIGSTAMGQNTTASGQSSTAMGTGSIASADYSSAMGFSTNASANYSIAMGYNTTAQSSSETAIGQFNTDATTPNSTAFVATDRLVTVGNGANAAAKSNALTILKNGNTAIGNINPNTKLDIDGNISLRSSGALVATITVSDIAKSYIRYSGTTNFNTIPNGFQQGQILIIEFTTTVIVTDNTGNLRLNGNLNATANDILELIWNGTDWLEKNRSVN